MHDDAAAAQVQVDDLLDCSLQVTIKRFLENLERNPVHVLSSINKGVFSCSSRFQKQISRQSYSPTSLCRRALTHDVCHVNVINGGAVPSILLPKIGKSPLFTLSKNVLDDDYATHKCGHFCTISINGNGSALR